ncbi:iron-sulfur cluster repair di-iron protein [Rapidithrix thailandica]|uniref:Iron-sulfur cluster repair di-iron protein n=1 Tax=Rapidithrix thailandica TaxID=413964 RepID=A0AAW9S3M4_9BACT
MKVSVNETLGAMVSRNYQAADVFEKYHLDFCCRGGRTLEEACTDEDILANVLAALQELPDSNRTESANVNVADWPPDLLVDYIEKKHHRYVEEAIPLLKGYLEKIVAVHGRNHPELMEIFQLFESSAGALAQHMKKEEFILFPYVRKLIQQKGRGEQSGFGSVANPIRVMMNEHSDEGERFEKIRALSNDYTPPSDACTTYRVAFAKLNEFEKDLHRHIHLENNILFPQTELLEKNMQNARDRIV